MSLSDADPAAAPSALRMSGMLLALNPSVLRMTRYTSLSRPVRLNAPGTYAMRSGTLRGFFLPVNTVADLNGPAAPPAAEAPLPPLPRPAPRPRPAFCAARRSDWV